MAGAIKKYIIGKNRLRRGCAYGFDVGEDGTLRTRAGNARHTIFLGRLDSGQHGCEWGRASFCVKIPPEMVYTLRVFASDEVLFIGEGESIGIDAFLLDKKRPVDQKYQLYQAAGGLRQSGSEHVLLYGQHGRHLYMALEVLGDGDAIFSEICVYVPGDNFYDTFPEVYRSDGEFFRRYLTVFSTMFDAMQEKLEHLDEVICVETAPRELLNIFAGWMGIAPQENLLSTEQLRSLVAMGYSLIRKKGTRQTLEKLIKMVCDEPFFIVENAYESNGPRSEEAGGGLLSGGHPYGFSVLINREADEQLNSQLRHLLDQFRPLRSKVNIVFIGSQNSLDAYCCIDINAALVRTETGMLDAAYTLNGLVCLE